ncbi:hypothetical protein [Nocardia sp. NBC_00511]|uniref:hypothetical protein n=1 Tax=Nocardia sp. NBC_00511 TaxID=2903591 RepID=UPI0030DF028A
MAYLERAFDGDMWHTELYDPSVAVPVSSSEPSASKEIHQTDQLTVVEWPRHQRRLIEGRYVDYDQPSKRHATVDQAKTVCGLLIPEAATVLTDDTSGWHLYTTCYNCAYRLWKTHAPEGLCRPRNGDDFPLPSACKHGEYEDECLLCRPPSTPLSVDDREPPF